MRNLRFDRMFRGVVPLVMMAAAAAMSGCSDAEIRFNGREGVPLADLDTSGPAPEEVTLLGPDRVLISQGDAFAVTVDGDADSAEGLRFVLADGALGILRADRNWMGSSTLATIRITLPAPPRKLSVAGSGKMVSEHLAGSAEVLIAGSGTLETPLVDAEALDISIAGSGTYRAAGQARRLELNIAGSGDADLAGLKVDRAEISIAGSGDAIFASDGEVSASIMGSGNVTVRGGARCKVNSMGSGTVTCERSEQAA